MRVAPVALLYHDDFGKLRPVAQAQSMITHTNELGVEGAVLQAYAIALAVKEKPSEKLGAHAFLKSLLALTENYVYREKLEAAMRLLNGSRADGRLLKALETPWKPTTLSPQRSTVSYEITEALRLPSPTL